MAPPGLAAFLVCIQCGREADYVDPFQRCEGCGSDWLDIRYDYASLRGTDWVASDDASMWRYRALLPLRDASAQNTLGEGWTPLARLARLGPALGHEHLYVKDEGRNPTGSFKARQASLVSSILRERGIDEIVICSTGNVAMAYAAYCARVGVALTVFLPELVPPLKQTVVEAYGARAIRLSASYYDTRAAAKAHARERGVLYDPGADNFVNRESKKTIALEIAEQLGWRAPDWYVQAVNGGPGPMGVDKGFAELRELGLIDRLPKIACVQSELCAPMVDSFLAGAERATPVEPRTRIVTLSYGTPGFSFAVLSDVVRRTGGTMIKVDEDRAFARIGELARTEGRLIAPAAAVAVEGVARLIEAGTIAADETVVINLTGEGVVCHEVSLDR